MQGPGSVPLESSESNEPTATLFSGAHQTLAEPVDEFAIRFRERVKKAVDRTHDDAPLGLTGDCTHRVEAALEFVRNANTELRIITNLFSVSGSGGWASCATAANRASHAEPFCKSNSSPQDARLALLLHYLSLVSAPASTDRYTDRNHEKTARVLTPRGAERRRHSRSGRRSDDPSHPCRPPLAATNSTEMVRAIAPSVVNDDRDSAARFVSGSVLTYRAGLRQARLRDRSSVLVLDAEFRGYLRRSRTRPSTRIP